MLNHITIMGRLTKDPELKVTPNGVSVTSFTVACDRDFKQGNETVCDFINCVAWRNTAEFVSKYFGKGRMAVISGRLQNRSYEDRDGNKRTVSEIVADSIYFGDSKADKPSTYDKFNQLADKLEREYGYEAPKERRQVELSDINDESKLPF